MAGRRHARLRLPAILVLSWLAASHADARPATSAARTRAEAEEHYQRGLILFDLQKYADAIAELERAFELDPRPEILYTLAQTKRGAGDCKGAIDGYRAFLRRKPGAPQTGLVQQQIERCQQQLAAPSAPPVAAAPSPSPAPTASPLAAPSPVASLTLAPPAPPSPSPRRPWYRDRAGTALTVTGLVLAAGGGALWAYFGERSLWVNGASDYNTFALRRESTDWADPGQLVAIGAVALGGVLLAAGLLRYALRPGVERRGM